MGQLLGFIYAFFLIFSNIGKTKKQILFLQTLSFLFKSLHYYLLGGLSGFLTSIISCVRNLVFYKIKRSKTWTILFVLIYILLGFITYTNFYSMLPVIATIIYTIVINKEKIIYIKLGIIITSLSWLIYNIYIISYSGIIIQMVMLASTLLSIKLDKRK